MRKVVDFVRAQKIFGKLFAQKKDRMATMLQNKYFKKIDKWLLWMDNVYYNWLNLQFWGNLLISLKRKKYLANCLQKKLGMITMLQKYLKCRISMGASLEFVCHCTWLFFLVWNIYFGTLKMQPISNLSIFSDYKWLKLVKNQIHHNMVCFTSLK